MKKLPRVCAIHDMSGFGKCSLTIAIPLISSAGIEVCPMPTSLLSTNTLFKNFTFFDFTKELPAYISHWKSIGLTHDCAYSGFLGSTEQINLVKEFMEAAVTLEGKPALKIVDPVMGDNGKIIPIYDELMFKNMGQLVSVADITTPNVTEACILTGRTFESNSLSKEDCKTICEELHKLGAKHVVLTGVTREDRLYNCVLESSGAGVESSDASATAYDYYEYSVSLLPFHMHGTGDLFTSTLTAGLVTGHSLSESVKSASEFVREVMIVSKDVEGTDQRGVAFELLLHTLRKGIYE